MCLELGVVPVRNVLMSKLLKLLHYILNESQSSTTNQVYQVLKCESKKRDFHNLVKKDLQDINITLDETTIRNYTKTQ